VRQSLAVLAATGAALAALRQQACASVEQACAAARISWMIKQRRPARRVDPMEYQTRGLMLARLGRRPVVVAQEDARGCGCKRRPKGERAERDRRGRRGPRWARRPSEPSGQEGTTAVSGRPARHSLPVGQRTSGDPSEAPLRHSRISATAAARFPRTGTTRSGVRSAMPRRRQRQRPWPAATCAWRSHWGVARAGLPTAGSPTGAQSRRAPCP
jgi:hypothetical protein